MPSVKKDQVIATLYSRNTLILALLLLVSLSAARPIIGQTNPVAVETSIYKRGFLSATKEAFESTQVMKDAGETASEAKSVKNAHSATPSKASLHGELSIE
jgi:hypothetical protein